MNQDVQARFLRYVKVDTMSDENSGAHPSSDKQKDLARLIAQELDAMGFQRLEMDAPAAVATTAHFATYVFDEEHCYLYGRLDGVGETSLQTSSETKEDSKPRIGFIAHFDTSPEASGANVNPQIIEHYDGGEILLGGSSEDGNTEDGNATDGNLEADSSKEGRRVLRPEEFPELLKYKGQTLITSDGTTLLGADDKAGIAEILSMVHYYLTHEDETHAPIRFAFTPDEEIGEGTLYFDQKIFDADYAYTVDGGEIGELSYENFNAAGATIRITGRNVHPGEAYGKMIHAARLAMEIEAALPVDEKPEKTRDHQGFFHLTEISGDASEATMHYIIRDHDAQAFAKKKETMQQVCAEVEMAHPGAKIELILNDTYFNMIDRIRPHMEIVERAAEAMRRCGIEPRIEPIRGGTDGATLSYRGLLCPNLCAGGHNFHGVYEFVSVEALERITELLIEIARGR